jgi:hypothetical protein
MPAAAAASASASAQPAGRPPARVRCGSGAMLLLLVLLALFQCAAAAAAAAAAAGWPYSAPVNWSVVPSFVFSTVQTTVNSSSGVATVAPEELSFLLRFPLIIMPKIQGPNTPNVTNPLRPAPACCAEDRIIAAAAAIKKAASAAQRTPPQVLLYFQSARLFPYYRLTRAFSGSMLLRHRNGSVYRERVHSEHPDGSTQWDYEVYHLDATQPRVAQAFLSAARQTLTAGKSVLDGVFADSAGDLRTQGQASMHLNQSQDFIARWNSGHAALLSSLQGMITEVLGPRGLLMANNADRERVLGRNFETVGPGVGMYDVPQADMVTTLQHEEQAGRVALVRGGYYTAPSSAGWERGYANCVPPAPNGSWDPLAAHIFNRTLAAFLVGAGRHARFQCTPGYVGSAEYRRSFDYAELRRPLGPPLGLAENVSGVWHRRFSSGTRVWLDAAAWLKPCVVWGDGAMTGRADDCRRYLNGERSTSTTSSSSSSSTSSTSSNTSTSHRHRHRSSRTVVATPYSIFWLLGERAWEPAPYDVAPYGFNATGTMILDVFGGHREFPSFPMLA